VKKQLVTMGVEDKRLTTKALAPQNRYSPITALQQKQITGA
jgi:hypothetical protein